MKTLVDELIDDDGNILTVNGQDLAITDPAKPAEKKKDYTVIIIMVVLILITIAIFIWKNSQSSSNE